MKIWKREANDFEEQERKSISEQVEKVKIKFLSKGN